MTKAPTTPTQVPTEVAETAAAVAAVENRSTTEQIGHWLRIGMQVERAASAGTRRVLAAASGDIQFTSLEPHERIAAHAVVDPRIADRAARDRVGEASRRAGGVTVSMDDEGSLIVIEPDGSRRPL